MASRSANLRLMLLCSRTQFDDARAQAMLELLPAVRWREFFALADRHNVVGLAFRQFMHFCRDQVPTAELEEMRRRVSHDLASNLHLTRELLHLLGQFEKAGLKVIPFKGPVFVATVYGNLALRYFIDLDLLIRPDDLSAVKRVLQDEGYLAEQDLPPAQERLLVRRFNELPFRHEARKVIIDVQWRVRPVYCGELDYAGFFARQRRVRLVNADVPALTPEDLLVILCVHGEKHLWGHLELVCGINELVLRSPQMDWPLLLAEAARWHVLRRVLIGLSLAEELLECPLPEVVKQAIRQDAAVARLVARVIRFWYAREERNATDLSLFCWQMKVRERRQDAARFLLGGLFTPTVSDWTALRLPAGLMPLYYVIRPFRLLGSELARFAAKLFRPSAH